MFFVRKNNKAGRDKENILHGAVFENRQWGKVPQVEFLGKGRGASEGEQHLLLIRFQGCLVMIIKSAILLDLEFI